ncbi:hypothetical protein SD80_020995 [Scytonema tolypothrichoides VB-61278]|nr:hypothetical protein SD80_020995 [Scytonema tolypothrichoides VB-61278]
MWDCEGDRPHERALCAIARSSLEDLRSPFLTLFPNYEKRLDDVNFLAKLAFFVIFFLQWWLRT